MTEFRPVPDPAGALDPPRRFPPTAVGAATPEPDPEREPVRARARPARRGKSPLMSVLQVAIALPLVGLALGVRAVRQLVRQR